MATAESIQHRPRGALIVLEGLDRSGKSSQAARLAETLRHLGNNVMALRFPGELGACQQPRTFLTL